MNIVLFNYSFSNRAGTERALLNMIDGFSKNDRYSVVFLLAGGEEKFAFDLSSYSIEVKYLNCNLEKLGKGFLSNLFIHWKVLWSTVSFFSAQYKGSVVIATNPLLAAILQMTKVITKSKLFIVSCEHFSISVSGAFANMIRKVFYPKMHVVSLTDGDAETISNRFSPKRSIAIPNASPFPVLPYQFEASRKTILSIGRLSFQKGYDLLINAFALFSKYHPDWQLIIVGDDYGEKNNLQKIIAQLNINNVELVAATDHVETYYRAASFYVMSSRFEGLPMVLLEAMSFGLPIVSFNCPTGPAQVVTKNSGILVENGNIQALAAAMKQLADTPALLLEKAKGTEERALYFTKDRIIQLWIRFLSEITNENN